MTRVNCWRANRGFPPCEGDDVTLVLPDLRQQTPHGCGRCALEVVWDYFGVRARYAPPNPVDGMSPDTLENALWNSGVCVQAGSMDLDDLRYHTRRGRPVVCCVTHESGDGHWVVVAGVSRGAVRYQCPADGPARQRAAEFLARWRDQTRRGVLYSRRGIACGAPEG